MIKNKIKICIAIPILYVGGGAEGSVIRLNNLLKKYYETKLLTIHKSKIDEEVDCLNSPLNLFSKYFGILNQAKKLSEYCRENKISFLICNLPRMNTVGILSRLIFKNKSKIILVSRNADPGKKINYLFIKYLWRFADKNVAVSKGVEETLKSLGLKNTETIYNVFDFEDIDKKLNEDIPTEDQKFFSDDKKVFINIGRLHKQKGQKYLINAFSKYYENNKNSKLIILGEGSLRKKLESLIKEKGLENCVYLLGSRKNVFPYLKKSDYFVLSSIYEGLPTVLIEAAYSKIPIICSDCKSGPREILTDNLSYSEDISYPYVTENGVIIPNPNKSLSGFEKHFIEATSIIKNDKLNSFFYKNKYAEESILNKWLKIFEKIINN